MAKKCFILVSGNTLSWWILGTCCLYLVHHLINIVSFKEIKKLFDLIRFHFNALCQGKIINAQSVSFHKFKTCLSNIYRMSADIRKFDIFRWGHYLKNFKSYVLNVPPILWKRGDTIQGRTLYKGGHYLRKYGSFFIRE